MTTLLPASASPAPAASGSASLPLLPHLGAEPPLPACCHPRPGAGVLLCLVPSCDLQPAWLDLVQKPLCRAFGPIATRAFGDPDGLLASWHKVATEPLLGPSLENSNCIYHPGVLAVK